MIVFISNLLTILPKDKICRQISQTSLNLMFVNQLLMKKKINIFFLFHLEP